MPRSVVYELRGMTCSAPCLGSTGSFQVIGLRSRTCEPTACFRAASLIAPDGTRCDNDSFHLKLEERKVVETESNTARAVSTICA